MSNGQLHITTPGEYNLKSLRSRLVLKALNTCDTVDKAAKALGVSPRTVYSMKKEFGIVSYVTNKKCPVSGKVESSTHYYIPVIHYVTQIK